MLNPEKTDVIRQARCLPDGDDYYWYNMKATSASPLGAMYKNKWLSLKEADYYFKSDGKMAKNETLTINGKKYTFGPTGYLQ